jgi:hypothetical protein
MIFKALLIVAFLLAVVAAYSDSFESSQPSINCDDLFTEAGDNHLTSFIQSHDLQFDYYRRNENYDSCIEFLNKFTMLIDEYRREQNVVKRAKINKLMRPKGAFNFNF